MGNGDSTPSERRQQSPDTASSTQNITAMTGGQAENVIAVGHMHGNIQVNSNDVQKLKAHTHEKIVSHTDGMIKVCDVDKAIEKLQKKNWVTVTGNAGEGKTTLGYMVLKHLNSENIFVVDTPEEFSQVSKQGNQCTIMLNDTLGQFSLDQSALDRWRPHISNILEAHKKSQGEAHKTRIIFVSRWDVLQTAKDYLERYGHQILHPNVVINLSESRHEEERLEILNHHLNKNNIQITEDVKRKIARSVTPHGFAHCCKMYAELKSNESDTDIEKFFESPLKFLNDTTRVLVRTGYEDLFKNMITADGKLILGNIEDDDQYAKMNRDTANLNGSYIMKKSGSLPLIWTFTHPSIYASVVNIIGDKNCRFIVKNASVSVLMQMVNIKENDITLPGLVNIEPDPALLNALCERFKPEIVKRNFSVFKHKLCDNVYFCKRLVQTCLHKEDQTLQGETTVNINESASWGNGMLHKAALGGRHTAVGVLLEHGADVNKANRFRRTALHYLCESGKVDASTLQLLITHGADVNKADEDGRTALHYLCKRGEVDVSTLQLLITHGADVNKADKDGRTALHHLCKSGKVDASTLQLLITHGADVNKANRYGWTALHYLCKSGKVDASTLQLLITHGADVKHVDEDGRTAFHYLCKSGKVDASTLQLLITHGADVNKANRYGWTALHYLCKSGKVDTSTLQLLITHGADVKHVDEDGWTALHYLCKSGKVDASTLQLLITHGADVNKADKNGRTALHHLCWSFEVDTSTLQLLITHGADVKHVDEDGWTALHHLCWSFEVDTSTLQLLITHGADVNKADKDGRTALHHLCWSFEVDTSTLQLLITHGADVKHVDEDGWTALHYLCESGKVDASTLQLLITHGADVNKADKNGRTALHHLCWSFEVDTSTLQLLITHGADVNKADKNGRTALHHLCWSFEVDASTLQLLITHGADVNKADKDGRTALDYLRHCVDVDTLQVLKSMTLKP